MLTLFARHGLLDLTVHAEGDLAVDSHHTVEDVGITLGQAFVEARWETSEASPATASAYVPMDETLARVVVDFSGRPFPGIPPARRGIGPAAALLSGKDFSLQLVEEFLAWFRRARGGEPARGNPLWA